VVLSKRKVVDVSIGDVFTVSATAWLRHERWVTTKTACLWCRYDGGIMDNSILTGVMGSRSLGKVCCTGSSRFLRVVSIQSGGIHSSFVIH
jgi:hypothetical protein